MQAIPNPLKLPADPAFWPHALAYVIACLVPILGLIRVSGYLWRHIAYDAGIRDESELRSGNPYLPTFIGVIERFFYVGALLYGAPGFIGLWLGLKVAGRWEGWVKGYQRTNDKGEGTGPRVPGRHMFNTTMIASLLSVLWAVVGVAFISWYQLDRPRLAWVAVGGAFLITYGFWAGLEFWWWIRTRNDRGASRPSGDELKGLVPHVAFEVAALERAAVLFTEYPHWTFLEDFLLHARNVREFLWGRWEPKRRFAGSGVYADCYFSEGRNWRSVRGSPPNVVRDTKNAIDKQLSHITRERADPAVFRNLERTVGPLKDALLGHWQKFMSEVEGTPWHGAFTQHLQEKRRLLNSGQ